MRSVQQRYMNDLLWGFLKIFHVAKVLNALWADFVERLLIFTPGLLRKPTPEGFVDNSIALRNVIRS